MEIKLTLDPGAYMPDKAHKSDAGFDLRTPHGFSLYSVDQAMIDTGVHMQIPEGYCGLLVSKSGLNVKNGMNATGLIDAGYSGSIVVKLYRNDPHDGVYTFERGDKICQIIILPVPEVELTIVEQLEKTDRGRNGFGSSGR